MVNPCGELAGPKLCLALAISLVYAPEVGEGVRFRWNRLKVSPETVEVSDIFHEVDEEVRREKLKQLWDRHSNLIVAVVLLIVLSVAGWRGYDWYEMKQASESGSAFEAAVTLGEEGKADEARAAFAKLAKDGSSGYRTLAGFRAASETAKTDPAAAVAGYDALANNSSLDRSLRDLAAVRAGLILVDTAPLAELTARLEPLTASDRPFRHTARETLALSAWKNGDQAAAKRWFDVIATDAETPAGTRQRMDVLMTLSGDKAKT